MSEFATVIFIPDRAPRSYLDVARQRCMMELATQLVELMKDGGIFTVELVRRENRLPAQLSRFMDGGTELDYRLRTGQVRTLDITVPRMPENAFELMKWNDQFWRPAIKAMWHSVRGFFAKGAY